MNNNQIPVSVFDSIEKVLRYIVPGLLFVFLFKISFKDPLEVLGGNITDNQLFILSPVFGFIIYCLHRMIFLILDEGIRSKAKIPLAKSLKLHADRAEKNPKLQNILYHRWAVIHFSLIFSELLFLFSVLFHDEGTVVSNYSCKIAIFSASFFMGSVVAYWLLARADYSLEGEK